MYRPPYRSALKPYGRALVELAREREDVVCLSGDLTRQCEVDLFQEVFPERFIHGAMAEANMVSVAGALARRGLVPFVHSFGVFTTRRPYDQIVNSIAYPQLPVRLVGFMPGLSSPGGPSHQAIDDVALMRSIPGMTVIDVADATETRAALRAIVDLPGPVYLRLKRGEVPVIFDETHRFSLDTAQILKEGSDVAVVASGMMLAAGLVAADVLERAGVSVAVANVPVIAPLDADTLCALASNVKAVVTAENHLVTGGLGTAVAEALATSGLGRPLRRVGVPATYAEGAKSAAHLFRKYGLSTTALVEAAWAVLGRAAPAPAVPEVELAAGEYAPV